MPTDAPAVALPARPVVSVGGQTVPLLSDGLARMQVHEGIEGLATLELEAAAWGSSDGQAAGFQLLARDVVDFGKPIIVTVHGRETLFRGVVVGIEAIFDDGLPPRVLILADDRLQDLRMTRRTRSFTSMSDADIVRQIAAEHRLHAQVDLTGPAHTQVAQLNQSDLAFVRERVRLAGGELWVEDATLRASARPDRAGEGRPAVLALGAELRSVQLRADLADQATAVQVGGWDRAGKHAISERAEASALGSEVAAGGQSGPGVLVDALGERVQTVVATTPTTSSEARAHAEAIMRTRSRRFVRGEGVCETSAGIAVGARVRLDGVSPMFCGEYAIVETRHRFDALFGLRSEFVVERPWVAAP